MAAAEAKMENVAAGATTFAPNVVKTTASATALCLDRHPREEAFKYHRLLLLVEAQVSFMELR